MNFVFKNLRQAHHDLLLYIPSRVKANIYEPDWSFLNFRFLSLNQRVIIIGLSDAPSVFILSDAYK